MVSLLLSSAISVAAPSVAACDPADHPTHGGAPCNDACSVTAGTVQCGPTPETRSLHAWIVQSQTINGYDFTFWATTLAGTRVCCTIDDDPDLAAIRRVELWGTPHDDRLSFRFGDLNLASHTADPDQVTGVVHGLAGSDHLEGSNEPSNGSIVLIP